MIPIDNLDRLGVVLLDQVPDPHRPITDKDQFWDKISQDATTGGPHQLTELLCLLQITVIAQILGPKHLLLAVIFLSLTMGPLGWRDSFQLVPAADFQIPKCFFPLRLFFWAAWLNARLGRIDRAVQTLGTGPIWRCRSCNHFPSGYCLRHSSSWA
jgi:hypothetical protein